jgi:hypothetical protein
MSLNCASSGQAKTVDLAQILHVQVLCAHQCSVQLLQFIYAEYISFLHCDANSAAANGWGRPKRLTLSGDQRMVEHVVYRLVVMIKPCYLVNRYAVHFILVPGLCLASWTTRLVLPKMLDGITVWLRSHFGCCPHKCQQ